MVTRLSDNPPHPHPNTTQIHRLFLDPLLLSVPSTLSNLTLNPNNLRTCRVSAVQECVSQCMCPIFWKPLNPDSLAGKGSPTGEEVKKGGKKRGGDQRKGMQNCALGRVAERKTGKKERVGRKWG